MTSRPGTVTVGPIDYVIDWTSRDVLDDAGELGRCDSMAGRICVHPAAAEGVQREIVCHELIHALLAFAGLDHELGEKRAETITARLSPVLLDTLRRNPLLIDWLTR